MSEETPLDRFKRVLTGGARAIAREPEVEVAWSADRPGAAGKNFRVPLPGRQLPPEQAAEARGFADSFALKIRLHDNALHDSGAPGDPVARAVYDAVEQVRYEALGAQGFAGVGENLAAATELRAASDPIARATEARDVPLSTAVSLMMREALTGRPIPSRSRAKSSFPSDPWMESKPRWPPVPPPGRIRTAPSGRSMSSTATMIRPLGIW